MQIVPGSGEDIPRTAAFCYDPDRYLVYLRDAGGCYWDDYTITETEFVEYLDQKQPPASIKAREARWNYCYDPKIDFVYAQELKPCSAGDRAIARATYIDHIRRNRTP